MQVEAAWNSSDWDVWQLLPQEAAEPIRRVIALLLGEVEGPTDMAAEVEGLRRRVAELDERLGRHAGNSSQPCSLDPPAAKARPPKKVGKAEVVVAVGNQGIRVGSMSCCRRNRCSGWSGFS